MARAARAVLPDEMRRGASDILGWLALLLARGCAEKADRSRRHARQHMQRLQVITYQGPAGLAQQCTVPTPEQTAIRSALGASPPPRVYALQPASTPPSA